jgi:hypothetical protein
MRNVARAAGVNDLSDIFQGSVEEVDLVAAQAQPSSSDDPRPPLSDFGDNRSDVRQGRNFAPETVDVDVPIAMEIETEVIVRRLGGGSPRSRAAQRHRHYARCRCQHGQ